MDHYCPLSHFKVDGKVWFFISAGFRFQSWLLFECILHQSLLQRRFVSFASYPFDLNARKDWTVESLPCYLQSINQIMKLNFHPKLFWSSDEPSIYNQIKKLHFHSTLFLWWTSSLQCTVLLSIKIRENFFGFFSLFNQRKWGRWW